MITSLKTLLNNVLWIQLRGLKSYETCIASKSLSKSMERAATATGTRSKKPIGHIFQQSGVFKLK